MPLDYMVDTYFCSLPKCLQFHVLKCREKLLNEHVFCGTKMTFSSEMYFRKSLDYCDKESASFSEMLPTCIYANRIYASEKSVEMLERKYFRDLRLEMPNKGCYVLARVTEILYLVCFQDEFIAIIEDENEDKMFFYLFNYPYMELPVSDDVILIKEPYHTRNQFEVQTIRCDCPTDIIILDREDCKYMRLLDDSKWCQKEAFGKHSEMNRDTDPAEHTIKQYMEGLRRFHKLLKVKNYRNLRRARIHENLACLYMKILHFEKSIMHAQKALEKNPFSKEAKVCEAMGYYKLRNFKVFLEKARILRRIPRMRTYMKLECSKACNRQIEKINSCLALNRARSTSPGECGDYISKDIRIISCPPTRSYKETSIKKVQNKMCRGVFAAKEIKKGTVIMVGKPLAEDNFLDILLPNWEEALETEYRTNWRILKKVTVASYRDPETFYRKILSLPSLVPFNGPMYTPGANELIINVSVIKQKCFYNDFFEYDMRNDDVYVKNLLIFNEPSFLNHSCKPNAKHYFYNGCIVIETTMDIKTAGEITINSEVLSDGNLSQKRLMLLKRGFH